MNKAYVVGYGLIDPLGASPYACFQNLINDKDYSQDLSIMVEEGFKIYRGIPVDSNSINRPETFPEKMWKVMTKTQQMCIHATECALKMSGLDLVTNVAVIMSTVANDIEFLEEGYENVRHCKRINPRKLVNRINDTICSHVSSYYKFMGASFSQAAACATGLVSIDSAMRMVDEYDYVVVGSGDAGTNKMAMNFFSLMHALGNHSKPFDDSREGFVMGEGFGVLILQSEAMVKKYNSTVHATLYPVGLASDAFDYTSPANDGRGSKLALYKALIHVDTIDAINAHATSTPIGDQIEYNIMSDYCPNIPLYAPKGKLGHTLAGSGLIETIYSIESMKHGIIPHVHNLKECSFDIHKTIVRVPTKIGKSVIRTLNNAFGFGGKCGSQVIEVTRL